MNTIILLEETIKLQQELNEFFGMFNKDTKVKEGPEADMVEEVAQIIDGLLGETRTYLTGDYTKQDYDKLKLFASRIKILEDTIVMYKNQGVGRGLRQSIIKKIINPLKTIKVNTRIVQIEQMLMDMLKFLSVLKGMDQKPVTSDLDDQMSSGESPEDVLRIAKAQRRRPEIARMTEYQMNEQYNLQRVWKSLQDNV